MRKTSLKKQKLIVDFIKAMILGVTFIGSFFLNVSAQNKTFNGKDLEALKRNVAEKLETVSYRSITVENIKTGKTQIQTIFEFVPPDRKHIIVKKNAPAYQITRLSRTGESQSVITIPAYNSYEEWIYIGAKVFYRNDVKGKWKQIIRASIRTLIGYTDETEKPTITTEYKLTPDQFVNQQESDLYEVTTTYKYSDNPDPFVYQGKYWINKNGLFAKTQLLSNGFEETVDYEYNSNIKIQNPLVKKPKKKK